MEFEFQSAGIRVNGKHYPIVKMAWANGLTLGEYIEDNYENRSAMAALLASFRHLEKSLRSKSVAHGDIQNGNVIVQNGVQIVNYNVRSDKELTLIDYDGVFVPGMKIGNGTEVGQRHFQHPKRKTSDFGPNMDRFSFVLNRLEPEGSDNVLGYSRPIRMERTYCFPQAILSIQRNPKFSRK